VLENECSLAGILGAKNVGTPLYELSIEKDTGKIAKVTSARRLETHFRSAQLDLWQISDTEWLLALRRPEPAARKKAGKIVSLVEQLVLPEFGATG